YDERWRRNMF
ncbi:unnamed protein product, partial [Litomosoides sigmodontis]